MAPHDGGAARSGLAGLRDRALLLVCLGFLLLFPPFVRVGDAGGTLFGAPTFYVYVFAVWAALIVLTAGLARRLDAADQAAAAASAEPAAAHHGNEPPRGEF